MTSPVAVVGPGSIGGAVASVLLDQGVEVTLCARQSFDTLTLETPEGSYEHPARVLTDPAQASETRWVFLAVKAYQVESAAPWLEQLCTENTVVAVLQNGIEHRERVEPYVRGASILPVVIYLPAEKLAPGVIEQTGKGRLVVPASPEGAEFSRMFAGTPRLRVTESEDFDSVCWQKLMTNAATGAIAALTMRKNEVMLDPDIQQITRELMNEVIAVGRAGGVHFPDDAIDKAMRLIASAANHYSSIAQDRRANRRLEWDARNAVVGRIGRRVGVPTPTNDLFTALLRACEAK